MKLTEFQCCKKCFDDLYKTDDSLQRIWIKLCGDAIEKNGFTTISIFNHGNYLEVALVELERLGYILTSENSIHHCFQKISVRVNGLTFCENVPFYCINLKCHEEKKDPQSRGY